MKRSEAFWQQVFCILLGQCNIQRTTDNEQVKRIMLDCGMIADLAQNEWEHRFGAK